MKLMGNCGLANCSCSFDYAGRDGCVTGDGGGGESSGGDGGGGAVVMVGVKLDSRSNELLTWALVKVAQSGDRVVAVHVIDPGTDMSTSISLMNSFDSVLAAYEGFCNLKQVDLKLKLIRGTPVRKFLAWEAISAGAKSLIVGTSVTHNAIRSSVSLARYCARNVGKGISVMAVDNGKITFQKYATTCGYDSQGSGASESRSKRRKTLPKSPLSVASSTFSNEDSCSQLSSSNAEESHSSMALVPVKTQEVPEAKSRWALLRKVLLHNSRPCTECSFKKSSVMQWVMKLPSRQSFSAVCPDHEQNTADKDESHSPNSDLEKGALIPLLADTTSSPHSSASRVEMLPKELEGLCEKYSSTCRLFGYRELLSATSNFTPENMIGKGGSSQVYRGILPDGKELAVKILKQSGDISKQFVSEIEILTTLDHKNIISLLGFCYENSNLLLVYDLLSRGSLEDNLHGNRKTGNSFGWEDRFKVALGVAKALQHLHDAVAEPIIHRDVKSSNILLSDDFVPKLSDFGLAMLASSSSYQIDSTDVAGTFGYLAPEYFIHGKVIDKIDVYAYGVVLLELLSGRKPIDNGHPKGQESLVLWAKQILKGGKFADLLDPSLVDSYDHDQIEKMVLAASLCIRRAPKFRPPIGLVVKLLQGDPEAVKWARQQVNTSDEVDAVEGQQSATDIQSLINVAFLNLEDDTLSSSSAEQIVSVEDYLRERCSRSSSFDQS